MTLKLKAKSEDVNWLAIGILKGLLLIFIAATGIMCIVCSLNFELLPKEQPLGEQQAILLQSGLFFVGIVFLFSTIIPASPVSHHNLVCKHLKET